MSPPEGGARLGTRFGPYELRSLIGVGGMGEVYRAYDTSRQRMVAIKLLRPDLAADTGFQERFRRESRLAARLQEPHIIPVHDFGEINGVLYIDMRLVDGPSLAAAIRGAGALAPRRAVTILGQVAIALDAAHANGLIHRDVKPENVLLTAEDFAYLVDFGIAHGGGEPAVTSTGLVVGSSGYMAPERFGGDRGAPAADIYSLTCVLYEMLTGIEPFAAGDVRQVWAAHMFSAPPRPSIMRRGVNRAFDQVIACGMAKDPRDRYATAAELARAAAAALDATHPVAVPVAQPKPTQHYSAGYPNPDPSVVAPLPRRPRRQVSGRRVVAGATVGLFALAGVLGATLVLSGGRSGAPTPDIAESPSATVESPRAPVTTSNTPAVNGISGTDSQGFVGHTARCDATSTPAALIRTAQSLAIICQTSSGAYYYRGERLRDGANLRLQNATRSGDGFVATNPEDGARYEVMPGLLTISSHGRVDSSEPALEYGSTD